MSAVAKLKEKLAAQKVGAGGPAQIVKHPAADEQVGKIKLAGDVVAEVADAAKVAEGEQQENRARAIKEAAARLESECSENQFGVFIAQARVGRRLECIEIDSEAGGDYIRQVVRDASGKMPPKGEIDNLRATMRIASRQVGRRITVHQRIAKHDGMRVIDLGDTEGQCVFVTADGWHVAPNDSVAFIRGRGYGVLPIPIKVGNKRQAFKLLFDWLVSLGVAKARAGLVVVVLVTWLRTGNAYPLLLLFGPGGSGKTTAARLILLLIDPTESMRLPNIQTGNDNIGAAAQHRHVLSFDNESKLSAEEQDQFCTCATGGEIVCRKMYTNGDVAIMPIHRPVVITALQPVVTRPDLMTRTIPVEFAQRETRRGENEILAEFLEMRPALLGALCELLVAGEPD
jgi:hypothetical protein